MNILTKIIAASVLLPSSIALADHSWGNYHWARTTNSFDLIVINSTTANWHGFVNQAVTDWSASYFVTMVETVGSDNKTIRRRCSGDQGTIRICNLDYGQTGWLGIAGISIDPQGHIVSGYTKLNDTYFNMSYYNSADWKQSVTCQELGHNLGLDHQDENFNNLSLFSCMDYQDPPYPYPNQHDYNQLELIYNHTDSYNSYATANTPDTGGTGDTCNSPKGKGCNKGSANSDIGWGMSLGRRGNSEVFVRKDENGFTHLIHVTWAKEHTDDHQHEE